ncbi:class A beta-lactamase-related serine hydrolase [Porifericola rhodea]|uniref:serine hydrolase n=1 Tax=Porifericola rhodea TaxID=930972 RepID=UPI00266607DC|nr:serine hydrolase [Porifericola rhodea]WKN32950.1 class A beta-lactamase-related serine hydrolase [Porifericola rhodea]
MRYISFVLALLLFVSCKTNPQQEKKTLHELRTVIEEIFASTEGDFALAFKDLSEEGDSLFIQADESFHAASTMKTPLLLEVYKQAEAGRFRLDDSLLVKNEFKSIVDSSLYSLSPEDDTYHMLYQQLGQKQSIFDLTYQMIIASSNLATNIVIELVGAQNTTRSMRSLGAKDIQILRGVEDIKAYRQGLSNTTTAYDLILMFEALATDKILSDSSRKAIIDILLDQKFNEMIPAHLPDNVKVAHKTGWISGLHHDSGIVYLPDGRKYVLVLLSKNLTDEEAGVATLAQASRLIYDYLN